MTWFRAWFDKVKQIWGGSRRGRALLVGVPAALLAAILAWNYRGAGPVEYYTARVERGTVSQVVQATGTINAVVSVQVGSQVSGNIEKIFVDFNSRVKQGQVIAQIEPSVFRARLMQAEAELATAQANVKGLEAAIETQRGEILVAKANVDKAQAALFDAKAQADRIEQLAAGGVVSAQQRDTSKAAYDSALAGLRAAEAAHEQAQARLMESMAQLDQARAQVQVRRAAAASARLDLDHTTIYAPIDGTVIARNVDVGQTVAASLQAPTLFVIAQDLTKMLVYAKTDEADVGRIRPGAEATFRVDSFPRETFQGRVQQVRMNAYTVQNVVTYDTIIEFDNPDERLFPGMTAYVSIPVAWEENVVKIPNGALRFTPDLSEEEIRALYARYNIPDPTLAARPFGPAAAGDAEGRAAAPAGEGVLARAPINADEGAAEAAAPRGGRRAAGAAAQTDGPAEEPGPQMAQRQVAGGGGGGGRGGGGRRGGAANSTRDDWAVVWKLLPNRTLQPVRVRLGVTDFTFTAMREGDLQVGDELVIGEASASGSSPARTGTGAQQRPPFAPGGGGMFRRF